jgi:hypothetical protein
LSTSFVLILQNYPIRICIYLLWCFDWMSFVYKFKTCTWKYYVGQNLYTKDIQSKHHSK